MRGAFRTAIGPSALPSPLLLGAGGLSLLLLVAGLLVTLARPDPRPAVAPPPCAALPDTVALLGQLEREGKWAIAATTAETALTAPDLCPELRRALAARAVADGLEDLFATQFAPTDVAAQRAAVDRYHALRRLARERGVDFPSGRQIAGRAYAIGQFLLARVAFEEAVAAGEVTLADQTQAQFYSSTLYNLGTRWADAVDAPTRADGLRLLATGLAVDRRYCVGHGEAWGRLRALLGPEETAWPAPIETPLLATTPGAAPTAGSRCAGT